MTFFAEVRARLGDTAIVTDPDVLQTYRRDQAGLVSLHPTLVFDGNDHDQVEAVRTAFDDLVDATLELGGTVTGEHGIGLVKRGHLAREVGDSGMRLQRAIKDAFDPEGILNPGKVV